MQKMMRFILLLAACLPAGMLLATHNKGGEIQYRKIGPLTVEATIITYTNPLAFSADRDTLTLDWGDGQTEQVVRANGPGGSGEVITPEIKKNIYVAVHTYAQPEVYWLTMTDPNRNAGILNVNSPNSENVPFHLQTMVNLTPDAAGSSGSPVLLEPPIDQAIVGRPFFHVPNAFETKGDSFVYALVTPLMGFNEPVPNYQFPSEIAMGNDNQISIDPETGLVSWLYPQIPGAYVIAIEIRSYRGSVLTSIVLRDMIIEVSQGLNNPPLVEMSTTGSGVQDVFVGDTVQVTVTASDPDAGQVLELSSSCGLYGFFQDTATFVTNGVDNGVFTWIVRAEHLRDAPYQLVFKVKDDGEGFHAPPQGENLADPPLANFGILRFRVLETTSVKHKQDISIQSVAYPNPTAGMTTIDLQDPAPEGMRCIVLNAQGKIFRDQEVNEGETQISLDLSPFPPALYFIKLQANGRQLGCLRLIRQSN